MSKIECKYCGKLVEYKGNKIPTMCPECRRAENIVNSFEKRSDTKCNIFRIKELLKEDKCSYCGYPVDVFQKHIDHIIPIIRGGTNTDDNLCVACYHCNEQKHSMTGDEYREYLKKHPEILKKRKYDLVKETLGTINILEEKEVTTRLNFEQMKEKGIVKIVNGKYKFVGKEEDCIIHEKKLVQRKCFILDEYVNGNMSADDFTKIIKEEL